MGQLRPGSVAFRSPTRRSFITGALAGTAAGALGVGLPGARADTADDNSGRRYSLPNGAYRIDLHTHFIPSAYSAYLVGKGSVTFPWSVSNHLAFMDAWQIQKSVVSVPIAFHFGNAAETRAVARGVNEYGRRLLDEHGDRFGAHITLPLPDVDGSIEELTYAIDTLHLDGGVMLFSHYGGVYLGDARYDDLYAELDRRGLVAWIHPTVPTGQPVGPMPGPIEVASETTRAAAHIVYRGVLDRFPNIKWQLSHGGGTLPYMLTRLAFSQEMGFGFNFPKRPNGPYADARRFIYDTALAFGDEQLVALDRLAGPERIVFGTDWPFTSTIFAADAQRRAPWWTDDLPTADGDPQPELSRVFSRPERIAIERKNAQQLYPGRASATS